MKSVSYEMDAAFGMPSIAVKVQPQGIVEARVAIFGNIDRVGDRIVKGAFDSWLLSFYAARRPLPIVFSHDWSDLDAHVGKALPSPADVYADSKGLVVRARFDMDTPEGRKVYEMLADKRISAWSFAYEVIKERTAPDKANELLELVVLECGPCLAGANSEAQTINVKSRTGTDSLSEIDRYRAEIDLLVKIDDPPQNEITRTKEWVQKQWEEDRQRETKRADALAWLDEYHRVNMAREPGRVLVDTNMRVIFDEDHDDRERYLSEKETKRIAEREQEREVEADEGKRIEALPSGDGVLRYEGRNLIE